MAASLEDFDGPPEKRAAAPSECARTRIENQDGVPVG
jgi:hypothetical protein